jgi:hypothetical protein
MMPLNTRSLYNPQITTLDDRYIRKVGLFGLKIDRGQTRSTRHVGKKEKPFLTSYPVLSRLFSFPPSF